MTTLEKIRAEIDTRFKEERIQNTRFYYDVLEILDKYAEQEPTIGQLFSCEEVEELRNKIWKQVEQEPCDDVINREAVIDALCNKAPDKEGVDDLIAIIKDLPPARPQEPKTYQFAKWVAGEIFDDMWEYNKDAFAEIACRKLAKLGIVREKGDVWELVEPQESEVRNEHLQ